MVTAHTYSYELAFTFQDPFFNFLLAVLEVLPWSRELETCAGYTTRDERERGPRQANETEETARLKSEFGPRMVKALWRQLKHP